jgi:hypothetical protein
MRLIRPFEILFLAGILVAAGSVAIWLAIWSPDALLRDPIPLYRQGAERSSPEIVNERQIHRIHLVGPDNEIVPFRLSLPLEMPAEPIPVVAIIGGFPGDPDPLVAAPHPGPNAVITYMPPFAPDSNVLGKFPMGAWGARGVIYRMPEEVSAVLAWAGRQEWADRRRINLVGTGLGAALLPAIRRRAAATGQPVHATVFIGGGTDFSALAAANLDIGMTWVRAMAAWLAGTLLHPLAPETHLPEISGPFMVVSLPDDPTIPPDSASMFEELAPGPKTTAAVPRGEGTADDYAGRIARVVQNWLIAQQAINP